MLGDPILGGLAGRFITIEDGLLRLDASGLLGIYYGKGPKGLVASSSPVLARTFTGAVHDPRTIRRRGMNWYPSPGSPSTGISRLLRDQMLDLVKGEVVFRARAISRLGSVEEARDTLAEHLVAVVAGMPEGNIKLALTAGLDSRLLFAALLASGRSFETFTQYISEASVPDIRVAAQLSKRHRIVHRVVHRGPRDAGLNELFHAHTDGSYRDADEILIPHGQYALNSEDVMVRGGCFEVGRLFYRKRFGTTDLTNADATEIMSYFRVDPVRDASAYSAM